jgi:hypothetical protein
VRRKAGVSRNRREAYERMLESEVRYRCVIHMASLKDAWDDAGINRRPAPGTIRARDLARELLHARTRSLASLGMTISSEMGVPGPEQRTRATAGDDQLHVPGAKWLAAVVPRRWSRRRPAPPGLQSTLRTAVMVRLSRFMGRRRFVGYPELGERRLVLPSCGVRSMCTKLSRDCQPGLPRYHAVRGSEHSDSGSECSETKQRARDDCVPLG